MERKGVSTDLSDLLHQLIQSYIEMLAIVKDVDGVARQTKILSFNSAIEAARSGTAGKGFAVIADKIQSLANESEASNKNSLNIIKSMNEKIYDIIGVRTADMAFDLIDKIERNLFERNCDVKAWASFDQIIDVLQASTEEKQKDTNKFLHKLVQTYDIYNDIFLADNKGNVVASGVHTDAIGKNIADVGWFKEVLQSRTNTASDMYYSKTANAFTMSYSCPVFDEKQELIGVLTTRINWDYIFDIIENAKISPNGEIYVINKRGEVIASLNRNDILKKDITELSAVKYVLKSDMYGYTIETGESGKISCVTGYAHTKGYHSYKGNNWSVIVREPF